MNANQPTEPPPSPARANEPTTPARAATQADLPAAGEIVAHTDPKTPPTDSTPDGAAAGLPARTARTRRFGGYEIVRRLSHGGQGVVYLARQMGTRRDVALKILPAHFAASENHIARFRREAQAAARLSHPNIVTVYDTGVNDKLHYIAYEYVDGPGLDRLLRQQVPLYEAQIVEIALSVARALQHAHQHGVLHRDVKPGNILVTRAGEVKLTDFGLARYDETHTSFQTTEGRVIGTPAFLSPEQVLGGQAVDERSDVYSLGCVIFNMATGRPPFVGDNVFSIMDQHRRSEPPLVRSLNPRISPALEALVTRAMAKVPDSRYPSTAAIIRDLEAVRQALRAPDTVRGGLAQIVAALDQINVVAQRIREDQANVELPSWQTRVTAAFLQRPMFWFGVLAAALIALLLLATLIGYKLGANP